MTFLRCTSSVPRLDESSQMRILHVSPKQDRAYLVLVSLRILEFQCDRFEPIVLQEDFQIWKVFLVEKTQCSSSRSSSSKRRLFLKQAEGYVNALEKSTWTLCAEWLARQKEAEGHSEWSVYTKKPWSRFYSRFHSRFWSRFRIYPNRSRQAPPSSEKDVTAFVTRHGRNKEERKD